MSLSVFTLEERPDLEDAVGAVGLNLPGFMSHDEVDNRYWERLSRDFPGFQLAVYDEEDGKDGSVVAAGHTIPVAFDSEDLPERGWDAALERGFEDFEDFEDFEAGRPPNFLCALLVKVDPRRRGRGISREVLKGMKELAFRKELPALIAPVRPTMKSRYPLTPMERYVRWRREDGLFFDPWMRVHERLGAKVVGLAPKSMFVTGSVEEWEEWTGMRFPESGEYAVEDALVPVEVDIERDLGRYVEPNVWMRHAVPARV